jgi:membrane protease YdiL (CAAX protease family)
MKNDTKNAIIAFSSVFASLVLYLLIAALILYWIGLPFALPGKEHVDFWRIMFVLYGAVLLIFALTIQKFLFKRDLKELGITRIHARDFKLGLLVGVVNLLGVFALVGSILLVAAGIFHIMLPQEEIGWLVALTARDFSDFIVIIGMVLFVAPAEEVFYRGFLLGTFMRRVGARVAIIVSTLLWVSMQMTPGLELWYVGVSAAFMGGVHGYVYAYKRRSIFPLAIAHIFFIIVVLGPQLFG